MDNKDSIKNFENLVEIQADIIKRTWISPEISSWETEQIENSVGPKFDGGVGTYLDG